MALVAYDNSDSSDFEGEDEDAVVVSLNKNVEKAVPSPSAVASASVAAQNVTGDDNNPLLFNLLPTPSANKPLVIEEDDEFLHKKATANINVPKPKARITVPSLSDFKDVEDRPTAPKTKTMNGKKSGLLSILPQPKGAVKATMKSLIPHVLTKKPNETVKKKESKSTPAKKAKIDQTSLISYSDESENEDDVQNDFFSINKPIEPLQDIPFHIDDPVMQKEVTEVNKISKLQSYFKQDAVDNPVEEETMEEQADISDVAGASTDEIVLDDEALMKLCGTRSKRKREEIQIVDVNHQEELSNAREMIMKGLMNDTVTRVSSSKGNDFTGQQRRKHQITYLAHQAKARQAELQNQWSENKHLKRQTRSKYGF